MKDDPIGAALRDLPRERAGDQFTGRVLARLGPARGVDRRRPAGGAWALRGALTAGALTAVLAAMLWLRPPEPAPPAPAETTTTAATAPQPAPPGAPTGSGKAAETTTDASTPAPINTAAPVNTAAQDNSAAPIATAAPITVAAAAPPATAPKTGPVTAPAAAASQLTELAEIRAELAALRREHRRFAAELAAMPEIGHEGAPVLYLGGDEGLDLVLDLGRDDLLPGAGDGPPRQRG